MQLLDEPTIGLVKKAIERDGSIQLPAKGDSMFPTIKQHDICKFEACDPLQLQKGQIGLFYSQTGQLVAHRFYYSKKIIGDLHYFFKGDTNFGFDVPVPSDRIIGILTAISKKQGMVSVHHASVVFWQWMVLTFPVLSSFLRRYLNRSRTIQR